MKLERLRRLLELVERELGAEDARLELGGRDPEDPKLIWCILAEGWRLVATFKTPPAERAELLQRLQQLASAFADIAATGRSDAPGLREPLTSRLDEELEALAARVEAVHAVVMDESSPVLWGTSEPRRESDSVESAIEAARLWNRLGLVKLDLAEALCSEEAALRELFANRGLRTRSAEALLRSVLRFRDDRWRHDLVSWRQHLLVARAIALVREHTAGEYVSGHLRLSVRGADFGFLARSFASIYQLILVFDRAFSELHAEAAIVHTLPTIERLVMSLPPVDPTPAKGRVVRFPRG